MRNVLPPLLALVLGLAAGMPAARADRTIGLITREAAYREAVAETDPAVLELTKAGTRAARREIGARIAARYGETVYLECLLRYRHPAMRHVFRPLLDSDLWVVRARSLFALKRVGRTEDLAAVAARLRDPDPRVREVAAITVVHRADRVPDALRRAHDRERSRFAKAAMAASIREIEARRTSFRPWRETLDGPDGARRVRWRRNVRGRAGPSRHFVAAVPYPEADRFDWPISWYHGSLFLRTPRRSFGAGDRHVGEDMAWYRDGAGVFAVADGVVRLVQDAGGDWGFLVVIEHRLPSGAYTCSVHGHLGSDLFVRPGGVVRRGQLIGAVALSCSVENGGYGAHLHFGLADGPYRRPPDLLPGETLAGRTAAGRLETGRIVRLGYDPHREDRRGRPGLIAVLRLPDGSAATVPLDSGALGEQTDWICGYVRGCAGWHHPRRFILRHGGVPVPR